MTDAAESARRYADAELAIAGRERLLLLVLDAGERQLQLTREALVAGDLAGFGIHLARAQAVIAELRCTLDLAAGPLADDLAGLYAFMLFHLTAANVEQSLRRVDEVRDVFTTIADGYRIVLARGL